MAWIDFWTGTCASMALRKRMNSWYRWRCHVAADDGTVEDVKSSEQRGRTVAFVVVGHRSSTARLHRQTGLGAVERLDLAHMGICGSRCSIQDAMVNLRSSLLRIQGLSPFA